MNHETPKKERMVKDERDEQIDTSSKSVALDIVITATEILTIICIIKGNPTWKGSLRILCIDLSIGLMYKYAAYKEKPYLWVGIVFSLIGAALFVWFGITG